MVEKRRSTRQARQIPGKAVLAGRAELECTIRDLNVTGARLNFRQPTFLPRTFRLRFGDEDQQVTIVWQRGPQAGVRFQNPIRLHEPRARRLLAFFRR
jgi:hypothetical protein